MFTTVVYDSDRYRYLVDSTPAFVNLPMLRCLMAALFDQTIVLFGELAW